MEKYSTDIIITTLQDTLLKDNERTLSKLIKAGRFNQGTRILQALCLTRVDVSATERRGTESKWATSRRRRRGESHHLSPVALFDGAW